MSEREKILGRIREALQVKAPLPGSHGVADEHSNAEPPIAHARDWLPMVGKTSEERFELFAKNAADLKADFQLLASRDELKAALIKIRDTEVQHVARHDMRCAR